MKNLPLLLGTIFVTLLMVGSIGYFFSRSNEILGEQVIVDEDTLVGDARNSRGNLDSTVTVVEFSDFQCPACAAVEPSIEQFFGEYKDRVRLVYRHFPIDSLHGNAQLAAQAAEAAAMGEKFWEYKAILFDRQQDWATVDDQTELKNIFAEYAQELEIDKAQFLERIELPTVKELVEVDRQNGFEVGVNATPTFFVNGEKVPAPQLPAVVDSLLADNTAATDSAQQQ